MNSMIIEKLVAAGVLSSSGLVDKAVLELYTLTHDILVVMYDANEDNETHTYLRAVIEKWTFQDKAMGEQFITFDFMSEVPVSWQIGDYCIFRGETYSLNYIPSVTQRSGRRKVMDAFKYESVKMDSYADELTRCEMLDVVLTSGQHDPDAGTNHTGSSSFQLFCGETTVEGVTRTAVMTLGDRILANLNRMYTGDKAWTIEYGPDTHTEDQMLTFSEQKVAQALSEVKNKFDLNYSIQGRTIKIGFELGGIADTNFGYGPGYNVEGDDGKGLFEIKKIADSSQQIVTRLRVLGSAKNLPYRYYNKSYDLPQALFPTNLQLPDTFLPVTGVPTKKRDGDPDNKTQGNSQRGTGTRQVKGDSNDAYIDKNDDASSTVEGIREASIRFDGSDSKLKEIYPTIEDVTYDELRGANVPDQSGKQGQSAFPGYGSSEFINRILAIGYKSDGTMFDDANIGNGILSENGDTDSNTSRTPDINIPQRMDTNMTPELDYYCGEEHILFTLTGVTQGKYFMTPVAGREPWFVYTPNNPGTPVGYIIRVKQTISGVTTTIAVYKSDFVQGLSAIQLPSIPDAFFMDDAKVKEISVTGTSTITVTFTPCTKRFNELIYRVGAKTLDAYTAEYVWSDIASMDSSNMPFHVFVKDMGFDFEAQFNGETPKIVMKSGQCVGREFTIGQNIEEVTYDGKAGYMLTLNRASDTSLNTYYPNARNKIAADDAFVIVGIDLPDAYIMAAEYRLLVAATEWLSENGDTHFRYQPSIDDIYLKRNYNNMVAAGTVEDSVFWKLYAGYKLPFIPIADGDSEPSAVSVTIESVSITMGEGLTRKVDIVLNDELKESTLKRVTRDVENLSREMQSAGVGMSSAQMEYVARKAGDERYLSKVEDDTAEGDILFNGTIRFSKPAVFIQGAYFSERADGSFGAEIDPEGNIHSSKNIEADGGVSAGGIADLEIITGSGGGEGTVKSVQIGEGEPIDPDAYGKVKLPAYPRTPSQAQMDAWDAKYDMPSGGIPKSDLSQSVQNSLDKADSALQEDDLKPITDAIGQIKSEADDNKARIDDHEGRIRDNESSIQQINDFLDLSSLDAFDATRSYIRGETCKIVDSRGFIRGYRFVINKPAGNWDATYVERLNAKTLARPLNILSSDLQTILSMN